YRFGDIDEAERTLDSAMRDYDDPKVVADALYWSSRIADLRADPPREKMLLEQALAVAEPIGAATLARVLGGMTLWEAQHADPGTAAEIGRRALATAVPESNDVVQVWSTLSLNAILQDDLDEGELCIRTAAEIARATGNLELQSTTTGNIGMVAHLRG